MSPKELLYKDHLRLFVHACVRQDLSPADTIRHLAPFLKDIEETRDIKIAPAEVRRMHQDACQATNETFTCEVVTFPTPPEILRDNAERREAELRRRGVGTPDQPIDLTRSHERSWYEDERPLPPTRRRRAR